MKKLLLISVIFPILSFGQYDGKGVDEVSRFRPGIFWFYSGLSPSKPEKVRKYDRLIFDITYNDWVGDLKPFKVKPSSIGFGVNLLFDVPLTKGNTVALGWGLNYSYTHIRHDNTFFTNFSDGWTQYAKSPIHTRGSLNYSQFSIPLEIRFRKESWKHFKIHLGGKIGYLFHANEKNNLVDNYGETMIKDFRFPDMQPWHYSAHIRLGIRNYALFGEYNLSKLFSNSNSTQLNLFKLGLSISLF